MSRLRALILLLAFVAAPPAAAQGGVTDGNSNTVLIGESPFGDTGCQFGTVADGTSNTLVFLAGAATECRLPIGGSTACVIGLAPAGGVTDGTSNTLLVGETPGAGCFVPFDTGRCLVQTLPGVGDGTSNTILIGEIVSTSAGGGCALPLDGAGCAIGGVADGTSNTLLIGEAGAGAGAWCTLPVAGTGGLPDVRIGADGTPCLPSSSAIGDGTSNTLLFGECAAVPPGTAVVPEPSTLALLARVGRRRSLT
jgi:hypothetical protein